MHQGQKLSLLRRLFPPAPPAVEVELTSQLLNGGPAIGIVGGVAAAIGIQAALNHDSSSASLLLLIALLALVRVIGLRRLRKRHGTTPPDLSTARRWERGYALGSFASSLLIGGANLYLVDKRGGAPTLLRLGDNG